MQLGMVGLGRMGAGLTRRLLKAGHKVVAYDVSTDAVDAVASDGATGAHTPADLVDALERPRHIWLMVPAAFSGSTIETLVPLCAKGDTIIDGGNTDWRDDLRRAQELGIENLHYIDVGTSGGVWGEARGFCMMVGGEAGIVERLSPIFDALAPGVDAAPRTPGREGAVAPAEKGWLHCGPAGAGHFVKMVHNGIEYGIMAAYAEGLSVLAAAGDGARERAADAETAPLTNPDQYTYTFDLGAVTELWRRGSVIPSWLLDLLAIAFVESPTLAEYSGRVSDSGEGRWTAEAAVALGVPTPVLTAALQSRFASQGRALFAGKAESALRKQFGGHAEKPAAGESST
jgi:6-phosphogluconate dehydrogenase